MNTFSDGMRMGFGVKFHKFHADAFLFLAVRYSLLPVIIVGWLRKEAKAQKSILL